tara:strand:+ start:206 stop:412 length:207 start_codon:yes stop_codon:yes gene_type:complete
MTTISYIDHITLHAQDSCTCGTYISPMEIFNAYQEAAYYEIDTTLSASSIAIERDWLTIDVVTDVMEV